MASSRLSIFFLSIAILGNSIPSSSAKTTAKRGVALDLNSYGNNPWQELWQPYLAPNNAWNPTGADWNTQLYGGTHNRHAQLASPVSSGEVAAAITAAKEASSNVLNAQQRVMAAKEAVIAQQRIASAREAAAQAALQKTEAAAQAQRAEASAAATAVVLAQQRLAEAKAQVAAQQRIAAHKEQHAASLIQKSANAAALEIQRSDHEASKLAALQRHETAQVQHASAAKDASLLATAAALGSARPIYANGGGHGWSGSGLSVVPAYHPWG